MSGTAMTALTVSQLLGYLGYVAVGGLLLFRALITPDRGRERRVVKVAVVGLGLLLVSAAVRLVVLVVAAPGTVEARMSLPVALVQIGVLVAVACYLPDLLGGALTSWRRWLAGVAGLLLTVALLLPMIVGASPRSAAGGVLEIAHVLAIGTWVGGMLAVALLVLPSGTSSPRTLAVLQVILRRSQVTAIVLVALLLVAGVVSLLLQPGLSPGLSPAFWVALIVKIVLFAALIAAAVQVRRQIQRAAFRNTHMQAAGGTDGLAALRRVVTVQMVVAAAAVAATAVLTVLTPLT